MWTKKILVAIISVLLAGGVGWFLISNRDTSDNSMQTQSEKVPDVALKNFEGKMVRLQDFEGKPLIINSWAVWCPFCRKELVDLATAQKEFSDKVVIIAVDRAESRDIAKKYTDALGVTGGMALLLDPSDSFYQSIGGFSMPETIFVDSSGTIAFHKRGPMDIEEIRERIEKLIAL